MSQLISLHNADWLIRQRQAGQCVSSILKYFSELDSSSLINESTLNVEQIIKEFFPKFDCIPTFLGYRNFPSTACISVNQELVHGIPKKDKILKEGDLLKIDVGATYSGAIADAAITIIVGKPKVNKHLELVKACQQALQNAISTIAVGKRLGCIGSAISHTIKKTNFGLIVDYGGHGLDENTLHAEPFVLNRSDSRHGIRIQSGMSLAIEPMVTLRDNRTYVAPDGWTVMSDEISSHFEHSIYIHLDRVEIITDWKNYEIK